MKFWPDGSTCKDLRAQEQKNNNQQDSAFGMNLIEKFEVDPIMSN
jgi:hypothetical protein